MSEPLHNILAIDTATMNLRLALKFGGDRLVKSETPMEKSHGQMLMKKIDDLFGSAGLSGPDLQAIVVSLGPGSFTGLRIGLAAAKGMAVALDIPIVGVHLLELAAHKLAGETEPIILLLPHRRDEIFAAVVQDGVCDIDKVRSLAPTDVSAFVKGRSVRLVGVKPSILPGQGGNGSAVQAFEYDAADLLQFGLTRLESGRADDISDLEPLYLRKSMAEIRFEQRR